VGGGGKERGGGSRKKGGLSKKREQLGCFAIYFFVHATHLRRLSCKDVCLTLRKAARSCAELLPCKITPVGNGTLVVADMLTCNSHSPESVGIACEPAMLPHHAAAAAAGS
jgi:hypothetical protein